MDIDDVATCYRAVASRDRRFDGVFYTGVLTTGIYCRPSCPARTPKPGNVTFHRTAASAQAAGFRACKRCLPDATPGSPAWDVAADVAGRAMRLIADGTVDREGVEGLSRRLGYSTRHLSRLLTQELGAGPLALARAQRAQAARTLVEATSWTFTDIAYAAGFASVRQFNDTIREVYDATPSQLRGRRDHGRGAAGASRRQPLPGPEGPVTLDLRLAVRTPFQGRALWAFLAARAVPGLEAAGGTPEDGWYARTLSLPHGPGTVRLDLADVLAGGVHAVPCRMRLSDLRDLSAAVERCRRLLDADCDPVAVDEVLGRDDRLRASVGARPGLRVPGHVDGAELALRAVLGQQVSVAAARGLTARLVEDHGVALPEELRQDGLDRCFPAPSTVASVDPDDLPMPQARARCLVGLAAAVAAEEVVLDRSADRGDVRARLRARTGIGPWTADYVAMRALGDPDVLPEGDAVLRRVLGDGPTPARAEGWRPWRSYAALHLWTDQSERGARTRPVRTR